MLIHFNYFMTNIKVNPNFLKFFVKIKQNMIFVTDKNNRHPTNQKIQEYNTFKCMHNKNVSFRSYLIYLLS